MSGSWSQGPQYHAAAIPMGVPPLICFNCGQNHLLINCPVPKNQASAPFQSQAAPSYPQYPGPSHTPQPFTPQTGPVYQHYPQIQQYGPPAQSQYGYSQPLPQQSYSAHPMSVPYANPPDQAPPNNQYPNSFGLQQYGRPPQMNGPQYYGSQQYGPPQAVPYQAPGPAYPPAQQNGGYNGNFGPPTAQYQIPPQQQWNDIQPPQQTGGPTPYQRQKRSYSDVSVPSTSGFQSQSPQSFQSGSRTHNNQQAPQKAGPVYRNHHSKPSFNKNTPAATSSQSKTSSASSTLFSQIGPTTSFGVKSLDNNRQHASNENGEDDELDEDQQFEWDMAWILIEAPPKETVALAQPLSVNFAMGPVPLMNPGLNTSVSRYARKDNVKEFSKSIREAPQWPFIKEDPAFAELDMNSPLIPIEDIPSWVASRHGMADYIQSESAASRKRVRLGEGEETVGGDPGEATGKVNREVVAEPQEASRPTKRQKNDECEDNSDMREGTPILSADVYAARDGTPFLANDDDAWAPGPGERAASPMLPEDPMEALLTSLGVTGTPKPVSPIPDAPYQPLPGAERAFAEQHASTSVKPQGAPQAPTNDQRNVQPMRNPHAKGQGSQAQYSPPNPRSVPQNGPPQHGSHQNRPQNPPFPVNPQSNQNQQHQAQFAPPSNPGYHHVPSPDAPHGNSQFTNPNHSQYGNDMNSHPQAAPPNQRLYNNGMNGQPHSANPNHSQHGNVMNSNYQSGNNSYGATTNQSHFSGPPTNAPYNGQPNHQAAPGVQQYSNFPHTNGFPNQQQYRSDPQQNQKLNGQQANGQFDGHIQQEHGPGPHQNINFNHRDGQFNSPPNRQPEPGPQQSQNFNGQPSYAQGHRFNSGQPNEYANSNQGPSHSSNKPLTQSQYGQNMQSHGPMRQDSGHGSTNGSFSNNTAQNDLNRHYNAQSQSQEMPPPNGPVYHVNDAVQSNNDHDNNENHPVPYGNQGSPEAEDCTSGEHTQDGSPLSPMSQEILGKLAQPNRRASRIKRRPAPDVDEAYSRRW